MYYDINIYYDNYANSELFQLGERAQLTSVNLIAANNYTTCSTMTCISIVLIVLLKRQVIMLTRITFIFFCNTRIFHEYPRFFNKEGIYTQ